MKRSSSRPKRDHYVPESYLVRFSNDEGFLHIFDRSSDSFRRQRPKEVMTINSYYRQEWARPGVDPNIFEKGLGEWLEAAAKDSLDRLIQSPASLTEADSILLNYLELQRIRVPRQFKAAKEQMHQAFLRVAPSDVADAIQAGEVTFTIKDSARFEYMRILNGKLHSWFSRMEWEIFEAADGAAFITSDSPVSLYNAEVLPPAEPGLALAGTIVFFPLCSRYTLLMRHPEIRRDPAVSRLEALPDPLAENVQLSITRGVVWNSERVNSFNRKMAILSDRLLVGESKEILQACTDEEKMGSSLFFNH